MKVSASDEDIAAATAYESLHVPAVFKQWAPLVVQAAGIGQGHRVLDVACGTGVLAREAMSQVGVTGRVCGLDAGAGMLAVASQIAPTVEWQQGLAEMLPYEEGAFDAVISQFGLMFFQDRLGALKEMHRVMVSGGRLAVAVWDALENLEAYPLAVDLLQRLAGRDAANALRAPFVLGDRHALAGLFQDAGFKAVSTATYIGRAHFPSVKVMMEAEVRGWLPVMGVHLDEDLIRTILHAAEDVLYPYVTSDGRMEFDTSAHIVTARK